jgi:hypothetical protein
MIDDDGHRIRRNWLLTLLAACCLAPLLAYWWSDSAVNVKPYADDSLRIYLAAVQRDDWATAASRVSLGD